MAITIRGKLLAGPGLKGVGRRLSAARGLGGPRRVRSVAEAALFIFALAALARAIVTIAAPLPDPPLTQPAPSETYVSAIGAAGQAGGNPFRVADKSQAASSAPLTESALNIVLHGTWRGAAGAAAMISANGAAQTKLAVGEEIVAGVTLEEVQDEFVVINNNGAREAVAIANREVDVSAPAPSDAVRGEGSPSPTAAPLRDLAPDAAAAAALSVSADGLAPIVDRPTDTIAAAAPHEPE